MEASAKEGSNVEAAFKAVSGELIVSRGQQGAAKCDKHCELQNSVNQ